MEVLFKQKLQSGHPLFGTLLTLPSPETAEILSSSGFDWLFIDSEHGNIDVADVQKILQAVGNRCHCIARTPLNDEIWIKRLLDTGVEGIIIPQVNSAEEVQKAVNFCKYPPEGKRSMGLARAHGYGGRFQDYIERANQDISLIIQVEHIEGVRNIHSIVNVPGVDCIFIGPYDLSSSMGMAGKVFANEVQEAIRQITEVCFSHQMPVGIFGVTADAVWPWVEKGFTLIAASTDTLLLRESASKLVGRLREKENN